MLHIVRLDVSTLNEIKTLVIMYRFTDLMEAEEFNVMRCQGVTSVCDYIYKFHNWSRYCAIDDTTFNDSEVCGSECVIDTMDACDAHSTVSGTGKLILKTRKKSNPEENYIKNDVDTTKKILNYIYGIEGGRRHMGKTYDYLIDISGFKTRSGRNPYPEKELTAYEKQEEHIKNAKNELRLLKIEKVIFNENATIVFFEDKKKVVVKCSEMDCYSKEAAIALAYLKWDVGEEYFHYVLSALTGKKGNKVDRGRYFKPIEIHDLNKDEEDK